MCSVHVPCLFGKSSTFAQSCTQLYLAAANNIALPQAVWSYLDPYDHSRLLLATHEQFAPLKNFEACKTG